MAIRDWVRPPRQLVLVSLVVAIGSTAALAWLSWNVLDQQRVAEQQRRSEALEHDAVAVAAAMERQMATLEHLLFVPLPAAAEPAPVDALVVTRGPDGQPVVRSGRLIYRPAQVRSTEAPAAELLQAERLEHALGDLNAAAGAYRSLAERSDPPGRALALARLARVQRKRSAPQEAEAAYRQLLAGPESNVDGLPSNLVAYVGLMSVHEAQKNDALAREAAAALLAELRAGRLPLTRSQYTHYTAEASRVLGVMVEGDADDVAIAEALGTVWTEQPPALGRDRRVIAGARPTLVSWVASAEPAAFTVLVVGPTALEALVASAVPAGLVLSLTDPRGQPLLGSPPPLRGTATLAAAATGLPWNVHLSLAPGTIEPHGVAAAQLFWVVAGAASLLAIGWCFIWRGISREIRLARLQSDFVAAVSHEFRSPLTSLRHIAELLSTDRLRDETRRRHAYEVLAGETDRLGRLVEDLLDLGRLQADQPIVQLAHADVRELVQAVAEEFGRSLRDRRHTLEVTLPAESAAVRADRAALGRVLWNLLDNAAKYSPAGGRIALEVTCSAASRQLTIDVTDEGLGIPPGELAGVFDRFVRGAEAKARRIPGTGIGLAMVREIVHAHGGDVSVRSRPGAGSTFTLRLPLDEAPGADAAPDHFAVPAAPSAQESR
jgi:signal transduction histidine kinase